jgi:hypothetical protein
LFDILQNIITDFHRTQGIGGYVSEIRALMGKIGRAEGIGSIGMVFGKIRG